ncbi:hypothetical protein COO60DRAFT_88977 [Scenedesmus sp. NREL 46B-D3]|nr:hypothetical protein COO60DRAFT_88977 [Scenedesmus sp. NREL 46B-D3]
MNIERSVCRATAFNVLCCYACTCCSGTTPSADVSAAGECSCWLHAVWQRITANGLGTAGCLGATVAIDVVVYDPRCPSIAMLCRARLCTPLPLRCTALLMIASRQVMEGVPVSPTTSAQGGVLRSWCLTFPANGMQEMHSATSAACPACYETGTLLCCGVVLRSKAAARVCPKWGTGHGMVIVLATALATCLLMHQQH